jgi:endonuclease IV
LQIKTAKQKYEKKQVIDSSEQEFKEIIADNEIVFSVCIDFCHSDHGQ